MGTLPTRSQTSLTVPEENNLSILHDLPGVWKAINIQGSWQGVWKVDVIIQNVLAGLFLFQHLDLSSESQYYCTLFVLGVCLPNNQSIYIERDSTNLSSNLQLSHVKTQCRTKKKKILNVLFRHVLWHCVCSRKLNFLISLVLLPIVLKVLIIASWHPYSMPAPFLYSFSFCRDGKAYWWSVWSFRGFPHFLALY